MLPRLFTRAHSYFLRFVSKTAATAATTSTYGTLGLGALDAPVKRLILCEPNLEYTPGSISHILYGYLVCEKLSGLNCATTLGFRPHVKDPTLSWYLSRFITKTPAAIPATCTYGTLDALGPVERLILCEPNLQYTLGSISHMLHGYLACEKLSGLDCVTSISFRPHVKNPLFTYHIDIHFNYLAALAEQNTDTITELSSFAYAGFTPSAHEEIDSTDADVQDIHLSEPVVPLPIHKAPTYPPGLQLPNLARYPITPPPTEPSVGRLYPSRGFRLQWPAGAIAPCPVEVTSNEPAPRILEHNGARFKVTGELGSGSFGRVMRAFVLGPGEEELVEVAIKVMNKDYLYRHAEGRDLVLKEKEAMERIMQASSCESVGLVGLVKAWCDEENIYFVMPLYHGDIYTLLEQRNLAHPSYAMRYIAAQLIQAIANAHSLGIMHRDIKPPNILISKTGHLVLADFGLAYVAPPGVDLAKLGFGVDSLCGTEVYEAPEMILMHIVSDYEHLTHELVPLPESKRLRYTCAVDVWAMGLVIYEIVVGSLNPWFHSSSREETRNRILAGSHKAFDWQAVESFDPLLADLLRRMLDYSPRRRITAEEAILHPYFQGIHWDILAEQESQGPIYPVPPPPPCTTSSHEYENSFSASDFVVSEEEDRNVRWQRSMDRREPQAHEFACSLGRLYDVLGIPREP